MTSGGGLNAVESPIYHIAPIISRPWNTHAKTVVQRVHSGLHRPWLYYCSGAGRWMQIVCVEMNGRLACVKDGMHLLRDQPVSMARRSGHLEFGVLSSCIHWHSILGAFDLFYCSECFLKDYFFGAPPGQRNHRMIEMASFQNSSASLEGVKDQEVVPVSVYQLSRRHTPVFFNPCVQDHPNLDSLIKGDILWSETCKKTASNKVRYQRILICMHDNNSINGIEWEIDEVIL